jgi:hypothetical protein
LPEVFHIYSDIEAPEMLVGVFLAEVVRVDQFISHFLTGVDDGIILTNQFLNQASFPTEFAGLTENSVVHQNDNWDADEF